MDPATISEQLACARDAMSQSEYGTACAYYQNVLSLIARRSKALDDANTVGKWKDASRKIQAELDACRDLQKELDQLSNQASSYLYNDMGGGQQPQQQPQPYDGYGYKQPIIISHTADPDDPDLWRPPTRDGFQDKVVRLGPPGGPAVVRANGNNNNRGSANALPGWAAGNGNAGGGQRPGAPPARAAPVQRISRGQAAPANGPAGKPEYQKPWQAGMRGKGGAGGPPGAGGGVAASKDGKPKKEYVGPDADLAPMLERELLDHAPGVKWTDIAGLSNAKRVLEEAAVLPLLMPEYFTGIRRPVKGILLFGPPGTGKTMLAKAAATETSCSFFSVSSSTLASKYRGESERMVRCLFDLARLHAPSIIFIDEVDSLCSQRGAQGEHEASRRVKTELLTQVDGCHSSGEGEARPYVMVLAATNFPWDIDEAMRRRLEKRIYIPLPGADERKELLELNLKDVVLDPALNLAAISKRLDGYSGDDIKNICRDAAMEGMRRITAGLSPLEVVRLKEQGRDLSKEPVMMQDFEKAMARINPSVSGEDIKKHELWQNEFGSQ